MSFDVSAGGEFLQAWLAQKGLLYRTFQAVVLDQKTCERLVVEYTLSDPDTKLSLHAAETRTLIGKFFFDQTGYATFQTMQSLDACLSQTDDTSPLAIPQAVCYEPRLRMLVQEKVPGVAYPVLATNKDCRNHFVAAGQALARLHNLPLTHSHTKRMDDHIRELIRPHPSELCQAYPQHRRLIEDVLQRLLTAESDWGRQVRPVPLHRDFQLRQLFYESGRVWVIDWDLFAHGDPAFDVAYFIVYLKNHMAGDLIEPLIDGFKEGYFALIQHSKAILGRIPTYETLNYLRRACRRYRLRDDQWQDQMAAMLRKMQNS